MELELGLKLARVADEFSSADFQIAKDRAGPLFLSRETDTMFILTIHLRGYQRRNIKIEINEDGTRIVISGEKEIQETVMAGWRFYKKEKEITGFKKAFKIPDGVILDRIGAKFDEDESILTISMPKKERGIRGVWVEEVKEQELTRGGSQRLQIEDHEKITNQQRDQETERDYTIESEAAGGRSPQESGKESQENVFPEETQKNSFRDVKEQTKTEAQKGKDERPQMVKDHERVTEIIEAEQATDEDHREENDIKADKEGEDKGSGHEATIEERERFKICTPVVAGSALLLSIVAFVIHFIRTRSQPGKRRE